MPWRRSAHVSPPGLCHGRRDRPQRLGAATTGRGHIRRGCRGRHRGRARSRASRCCIWSGTRRASRSERGQRPGGPQQPSWRRQSSATWSCRGSSRTVASGGRSAGGPREGPSRGRRTSRLNKTPPMGEPKATDMPEAAAADRTSRFRAGSWSACADTTGEGETAAGASPSLPLMLPKSLMKRLAQQQATWTKGPSLPSHMPDPTARIFVDSQPAGGGHHGAREQLVRAGTHPGGGAYQAKGLDDQGPGAQEAAHDKASQDGLDFRDAAMLCVSGILANEQCRAAGQRYLAGTSARRANGERRAGRARAHTEKER